MKTRTTLLAVTAAIALAPAADTAAQGLSNRCVTPRFWCFLPQVAPIGASCYCGSPQGPVPGTVR